MCNLKAKWWLHIRGGGIFKLGAHTEITNAAARDVLLPEYNWSGFWKKQPLGLNQLKSSGDYGLRHQCGALINLQDIYLTPQWSCLASRRKSPINDRNNHHLPCRGG